MCKAVLAKFTNGIHTVRSAALQSFLKNTAPLIIVEAADYDAVWGVGLSVDDAPQKDGSVKPGIILGGTAALQAAHRDGTKLHFGLASGPSILPHNSNFL